MSKHQTQDFALVRHRCLGIGQKVSERGSRKAKVGKEMDTFDKAALLGLAENRRSNGRLRNA